MRIPALPGVTPLLKGVSGGTAQYSTLRDPIMFIDDTREASTHEAVTFAFK